MDITELVKRAFDTRPGGETEAEMAREMLHSRLFENEKTRELRIWHGDTQSGPNIMDLLAEYKKPTELKISQLEREVRRKTKQITELVEQQQTGSAPVTTNDDELATLRKRVTNLETVLTEKDQRIIELESAKLESAKSKSYKPTPSSHLSEDIEREITNLRKYLPSVNGSVKRKTYASLTYQNTLFAKALEAIDAKPIERSEVRKLAEQYWPGDWRAGLAKFFGVERKRITNVFPVAENGKPHGNLSQYMKILRFVDPKNLPLAHYTDDEVGDIDASFSKLEEALNHHLDTDGH